MMKKNILIAIAFFLGIATTTVYSQTCGEAFTDQAGPNANYANNSDNTTIICPTNAGEAVTVTFTSFDVEAEWDALYVFNGNSPFSQQISSTNPGANVPGGLAGGFWGTTIPGPFTSTNDNGCLTFRFRSDDSVNEAGWIANVSCGPLPSCRLPNSTTVNEITTTSATLSWMQPVNPDSTIASTWHIVALPCGSPAPIAATTGFVTSNTSTSFILTGLAPATCYDVYVRALCNGDPTPWCGFPTVTTLEVLPSCGAQFTDSGGAFANYASNTNTTTTICPTAAGDIVSVIFSEFNTEVNWDALYVYDGSSVSSPQIASTNPAANVPGGMPGGYWGTTIPGPFTSTSLDGCLTFRFRSDGTITNPGWVANVVCTPSPDRIFLVAFVDENSNGIRDTNEPLFQNGSFIYQQNNNGTNINGYSPTGQFALYDTNPANTYSFSYQIQPDYVSYFNPGTTTYNNISIPIGSGAQFLYFPVTVIQAYNDVTVSIVPYAAPRPGNDYLNKIIYKNQGTAATDGTLTFVKPTQINTYLTNPTGIITNATGFTYNFTNLLPNESREITVSMTVPLVPVVNINDLLIDSATISAPSGDINLANNSSINSQIVVNSYDPNDKMESRGKTIPFNTFAQSDYFFYTIRFQNNGTADAIDVRIEDFLNSQIDETSVLMISSSHNYTMKRIGNQLVWDFKNILLTPSSLNEDGSKGYVQFKVKLNPGFQAGDIIPNNASIYFDSNPAIVTATFNSKFTLPLGIAEFDAGSLVLYPNPAHNTVQLNMINTNERLDKIVFYDILGKAVKTISAIAAESLTVDVSNLSKGVYLVEMSTENNFNLTKKLIIQ
jgi:uncharacterized repeat protein (TIGR01451 family)